MQQSLNELYQLSLSGDEAALGRLVGRMMPAIHAGAVHMVCPGLDCEDAEQEGLIGLFSAIRHYDSQKGASFSTYALTCIRNAQRSARRVAAHRKNAPLNCSLPLEDFHFLSQPSPEELLVAAESRCMMMEHLRGALSPLESRVFLLHLDGLPNRQIAVRLSLSAKTVENALSRARRKLRQTMS